MYVTKSCEFKEWDEYNSNMFKLAKGFNSKVINVF